MRCASAAMMLLVSVPVKAEEFPWKDCGHAFNMLVLKLAVDECPNVQVTFRGHRYIEWATKNSRPACVSLAESKIKDDFKGLQGAWCSVYPKMTNKSTDGEPFVVPR